MRRVCAIVLAFVLLVAGAPVAAYAADGDDIEPVDEEIDTGELLRVLSDYILSLGSSSIEEEPEELPPIMEHMLDASAPEPEGEGFGIMPMSVATQPNYPYTGGAFMAVNTNYGNGILMTPEPYKKDTFGFIKGSDRIVNLTNSTINGYFVMGGTTYSARFQRYMEPEYAYVSGSTTTWRTLTISAMTDSNVQFLDETGERGIQRPYLSLEARITLALQVFILLAVVLSLLKRR